MNNPTTTGNRTRLLLSLAVVALLVAQSSWFFTAMCLMAGAMVVTGWAGSWRDWFTWVGMLVGFALFAELRARMGPTVEVAPFFLYVIQLETLGGLIPVSSVWFQDHLQSPILDAVCTAIYISFFIVPQAVVVYLWRNGGPFSRYVAAACLLFATAVVIHYLLPTAPPWMASEAGLIPPLDRIGMRVLLETSATLTEGGYQAQGNDVAAMPSVHQGLTVLAMIALASHRPSTRWTAWIYSILMLFSISYLGDHYLADGIAGAGMAWGFWWLFGALGRRNQGSPAL